MTQPDRALQGAFAPIASPPTIVDSTATTTAALLTADSAAAHGGVRRVRLLNTSAAATLALILLEAGATPAGTVASGMKIPAGQSLEVLVRANLRCVVVADASCTFNAAISDV